MTTFFLDWGIPFVVVLDSKDFSITQDAKSQLIPQANAVLSSPKSSIRAKKIARSLLEFLQKD